MPTFRQQDNSNAYLQTKAIDQKRPLCFYFNKYNWMTISLLWTLLEPTIMKKKFQIAMESHFILAKIQSGLSSTSDPKLAVQCKSLISFVQTWKKRAYHISESLVNTIVTNNGIDFIKFKWYTHDHNFFNWVNNIWFFNVHNSIPSTKTNCFLCHLTVQDLPLKHSKTTQSKKMMGTKEKLDVERRKEVTRQKITGRQVLHVNGSPSEQGITKGT